MITQLILVAATALVTTLLVKWLACSGCNGHHWEDWKNGYDYRIERGQTNYGARYFTLYEATKRRCQDCNETTIRWRQRGDFSAKEINNIDCFHE
jgi:hypothetical protein